MAKRKKGLLPRIEILIVLIFLLSFIAWAATKCSAKKEQMQQGEPTENAIEQDTGATTAGGAQINLPKLPPKEEPVVSQAAQASPANRRSRLYVTIDGLKLRKAPNLQSEVILQLPLFEEVYFMDEVTDFTTELSLGKEMANEPWVKVKHSKGHEGWVYGAGVHYHKKKREGVE